MEQVVITIHRFNELTEDQQDRLSSVICKFWGFEEAEDDPDLFILALDTYRLHLVWNSEGHWEMEFLGNESELERGLARFNGMYGTLMSLAIHQGDEKALERVKSLEDEIKKQKYLKNALMESYYQEVHNVAKEYLQKAHSEKSQYSIDLVNEVSESLIGMEDVITINLEMGYKLTPEQTRFLIEKLAAKDENQ